MKKRLFVAIQHILPQRWLSRLAGKLATCTWQPLVQRLITAFISRYGIDLSIAERQMPTEYTSFQDFFTRALANGSRPLAQTDFIIPCDGTLADYGRIANNTCIQAKKHSYSIAQLIADDVNFNGGHFATIYLAPRDYHRVHMPCDGKLLRWRYVPGKLFSVNKTTAQYVAQLYARNERLICHFQCQDKHFYLILVGAMLVSGIVSRWHGKHDMARDSGWQQETVSIKKGDEVGYFCFGSTAIVLADSGHADWRAELTVGQQVQLGQALTGETHEHDNF